MAESERKVGEKQVYQECVKPCECCCKQLLTEIQFVELAFKLDYPLLMKLLMPLYAEYQKHNAAIDKSHT